jgi:hypothetical protein
MVGGRAVAGSGMGVGEETGDAHAESNKAKPTRLKIILFTKLSFRDQSLQFPGCI